MKKIGTGRLLPILITAFLLCCSVGAQELSVRNRPFKGETRGKGLEMLVRLDELSTALGVSPEKTASGWSLDGSPIDTVEENDATYVKLADLKEAGYTVSQNKDLNTIDVIKAQAKQSQTQADDSAWTMVHYGANW